MKIRKITAGILCLLSIVFTITGVTVWADTAKESTDTAKAPVEPQNLYARAACLMDASSGRVLFEKDGSSEMAMASTTKIMTLIVTLENGSLDDIVTVSSAAARQPDVQLNINTGEQYYLKDLVYSLMLESHNDTAVAIAEHVGGSVEGFAALMNQKAAELGLDHTHFVTPNGLDADGHYTSAEDLARIMSYCIMESPEKEAFLKITRTASHSFTDLGGKRSFSCNNHNAFLSMMEGALSGKTGFTGNAGYCYVGALERDGRTFVVALLACGWPNNKTYKWADTRKLMSYGLDNYTYRDIFQHDKTFRPVPVEDGQTTSVELVLQDEKLPVLMRNGEKAEVRYEVPKILKAPVKKGMTVGSVQYYLNGKLYRELPVLAKTDSRKIDFKYCMDKILKLWTL